MTTDRPRRPLKPAVLALLWTTSLTFSLNLSPFGEQARATNPPPPCQNCNTGWVSVTTLYGAIECAHGPTYGKNGCPDQNTFNAGGGSGTYCWELNGNKGTCKCFVCGIQAGCEDDIEDWIVDCGLDDPNNPNYTGCNIVTDTVKGPTRQTRPSTVQGGGACNYGNNGFYKNRQCGWPEGFGGHSYSCKSSNCTSTGAWTQTPDARRQKCG